MSDDRTMNTVIHAAFRRDLDRFDRALDGFHGSPQRADELGRAWDNLATQLRNHHEDEEALFWPALVRLSADETLVGDLDGEHARMLMALDAATAAMQTFRADPSAATAATARTSIGNLRVVLVEHLDHEERDLEPLAAQHRKSPEIRAAQQQVRKRHKGSAGTFFAWLSDGADADTTAILKSEVPAPVLFLLNRLGGRGYRRTVGSVWSRG
jgi:hypothetical protein